MGIACNNLLYKSNYLNTSFTPNPTFFMPRLGGNRADTLVLVKGVGLHYNGAALNKRQSGRGSARLERTVRVREVGGSNPPAPTFYSLYYHGCSFWATVMHLIAGGITLPHTAVHTVFQPGLLSELQKTC
jgi:hypothetical protein